VIVRLRDSRYYDISHVGTMYDVLNVWSKEFVSISITFLRVCVSTSRTSLPCT
jgi:hypothetical protein